MTYNVYDKSAALGSPYELFAFLCPTGDFFYTNNNEPVSFDGNVYTPLQVSRGTLELNALTDSVVTTQIKVPVNCELYYQHGRGVVHPEMRVEIRRAHRGTTGVRLRGIGRVTNHLVSDEIYTLTIENVIQTEVQRGAAAVYYQNRCNHAFGDARCKVNITDYERQTVVQELWNYSVRVFNDGFANGELAGGRITIGSEVRTIVDNNDNWLQLAYPFVAAVVGDDCTVQLECDLSHSMCKGRFGNGRNYGGFPTMPEVNPGLPDFEIINTTKTTEETKARKRPLFRDVSIG